MADTPISPPSGSVTASGVAAALAMSLVIAPGAGAWSSTSSAPTLTSGTVTAIAPGAGAFTLAGIAPTVTNNAAIVSIAPSVGSMSLAGVAPAVSTQLQIVTGPGAAMLIVNGTATGNLRWWAGGLSVFTAVCANWNGATVSLQMIGPDGSTLLDVSPSQTTLTANGGGAVQLPPCWVQATVRNAVPSSGVYASLTRVTL